MELDGNNWIIGNDGTNGTDWAETIDGADRIYEPLKSWLLLWIGGYDWIDRADVASGISGMKGGI